MEPPTVEDLADLESFERLASRQRAHRRFLDAAVAPELFDRIVAAATRAPSAANSQPCVFVAITDPARRGELGSIVADAWHRGGRAWSERNLSQSLLTAVDAGATGGISSAPMIVVVCGDARRSPRSTLGASVLPAVQNLLLASTAAGLGSAMTTLGIDDPALPALLGLADHLVPLAIVPLGHPARALGPNRREPARVIHDGGAP